MIRHLLCAFLLLIAGLEIPGCATSKKPEPVIQVNEVDWGWAGLAPGISVAVQQGYVHLVPPEAVDVFPTSLAIARVGHVAGQFSGPSAGHSAGHSTGYGQPRSEAARLAMQPGNELQSLLELFDDVWLVSSVFPVTYARDYSRLVDAEVLLNRARERDAGLCLIYRESMSRSWRAEIRGVVFDVRRGTPIAAIHAEAESFGWQKSDDPPPSGRLKQDFRHVDPLFQARERFVDDVRQCVLVWIEAHRNATLGQPQLTADPDAPRANTALRLGANDAP